MALDVCYLSTFKTGAKLGKNPVSGDTTARGVVVHVLEGFFRDCRTVAVRLSRRLMARSRLVCILPT